MKPNITHIIKIILMFATVGCVRNPSDDRLETISLDNAERLSPDSIVESLEVIPLAFSERSYPVGVASLYASDNDIVVFDLHNSIFVYDKTGTPRSDSSDKIGHGAGEFSVVTAFSYNPCSDNLQVITPVELLTYDMDFNLVDRCKVPTKSPDKNGRGALFFGYVHDLSKNRHLFIPETIFDDNHQMMLFDSESGKIISSIDYADEIIANTNMQFDFCFETNSGKLLFYPPGVSRNIFSLDIENGELTKEFRISLGKNELSSSDLDRFNGDGNNISNYIMTCSKNVTSRVLGHGDKIAVIYKDGASVRNLHTLLYDTSSKKTLLVDSFVDGKMEFPLLQYCNKNGFFAIVESERLPSILSSLSTAKVKQTTDSIPDGSLILLNYKLKRFGTK